MIIGADLLQWATCPAPWRKKKERAVRLPARIDWPVALTIAVAGFSLGGLVAAVVWKLVAGG